MKKSLLLASMAALALSASAQAVDPATYTATDKFQLTSKWLMARVNNGASSIGFAQWESLPFGNEGKGTMATMLNGKCYISCSTDFVAGDEGPVLADNGHLLVFDAATGAFEKDLKLTVDGAPLYGLLCVNTVGHDQYGHLYVANYRQVLYKNDAGTFTPVTIYIVDPETGACTLAAEIVLNDVDGPTYAGRVDFIDVVGDLTVTEAPCVVMAIPNEQAVFYGFRKEQGGEDWDGAFDGFFVIDGDGELTTDPEGQTAWNYSPYVSIVRDQDVTAEYFYADGHTTRPALYNNASEMVESLAIHDGDDAWASFLPSLQPNGIRQIDLAGTSFIAYPLDFGDDKTIGGHIALVQLDDETSLNNATPLWVFPESGLGVKKGEGRFLHSIDVSEPYDDGQGHSAVDVMIFKDCNGLGVYQLAEAGFVNGVNDVVVDDSNAPVEYFNLNGVRMQGELAPGLYISRQGSTVSKVVIK